MARRRTTLAQVAEHAGVSPTTVSFVLNDRDAGISAVTRERVWNAARELDYRPNVSAKALRSKRTHTLALITDEIASTPYAGAIIRGAQEQAWRNGYVLFVVNTNSSADVEHAAVETVLDRQVEGILFASMHTRAVELSAGMAEVPTVLVNCYTVDAASPPPAVLPDEFAGGRDATRLLLEAGHRRIALINGDERTYAWRRRRAGYEEALRTGGVPIDRSLVVEGDWLPAGAYDITHTLLDASDAPTALFCVNDRSAHGAYDAIRELGLSVPADVSVVGYDDQEMSRFLRPALTTFALPHYELGRRGCELLLTEATSPGSVELIACPPRLRASVAAPSR